MVPSPDTAEKLHQFFPKISTEWVSTLSPPPAGEELAQLHERMGAVISVIVSRVGEGKIGRSHRGENNGAQLSRAEIVMENIATLQLQVQVEVASESSHELQPSASSDLSSNFHCQWQPEPECQCIHSTLPVILFIVVASSFTSPYVPTLSSLFPTAD